VTISVIIPARLASTRLPGKVLLEIGGKPMVQLVYERARRARLVDEVVIATDSPEVESACRAFTADVMPTSPTHASGTDRIGEVARRLGSEVILGVQADEPLIDPALLDRLAGLFDRPDVRLASAMTRIRSVAPFLDPNVVKVVCDRHARALFFSRSPIPSPRDARGTLPLTSEGVSAAFRHIGVYAWRRETLLRFVELPPTDLERIERLEQLRALENGMPIDMVETDEAWPSVDTQEDLDQVRALLEYR
jgi:3-deoxy-manno-octulosonate cytidylyltransferase (CMP-KDO synthetase)